MLLRSIFIALVPIFFCAALQAQEMSRWNFDKGVGNVIRDSSGDRSGALVGEVSWGQGWSGSSLLFDGGENYAQIGKTGDSPTILPGSDFTISVWINLDTNDSRLQGIYGYHDRNNQLYSAYSIDVRDRRLEMWLGGRGDARRITNLSPVLEKGEWTHLSVVRDGDYLRSYVNGVLYTKHDWYVDMQGAWPQGTGGNSKELIGGRYSGEKETLNGRIDDLKIWQRALPADEIHHCYSDASAHWKFDRPFSGGRTFDDHGGAAGHAHGAAKSTFGGALPMGQPGESLVLDGDKDYVQIGKTGDSPTISPGNDFTICVWVNMNSNDPRTQGIYGYHDNDQQGDSAYAMDLHNRRLQLWIGSDTASQNLRKLSPELEKGEWAHLSIVRQGANIRSYFNGFLYTQNDLQVDLKGEWPQAAGAEMRELIGGRYTGRKENFHGRIDDLRIWQRTLSADEINNVFYDSMINLNAAYKVSPGREVGKRLQAAFDKLQGDNKFLLLEKGNYFTDREVTLGHRTKLIGRKGKTRLLSTPGRSDAGALLKVNRHCHVYNLKFDGNNQFVDGLLVANGNDSKEPRIMLNGIGDRKPVLVKYGNGFNEPLENVILHGCSIENFTRSTGNRVFGVRVWQRAHLCRNIRIRSCDFLKIRYTGHETFPSSRGIYLSSLKSHGCTTPLQDIAISDCTFSDITSSNTYKDGDCIQFQLEKMDEACTGLSVTNCDFKRYSKRAIKLSGVGGAASDVHPMNVLIAGNTISQTFLNNTDLLMESRGAISLYGDDNIVERNFIDLSEFPRAIAMDFVNADGNTVRDNTILLHPNPVQRSSGFFFQSVKTESHSGTSELPSTKNAITRNKVSGGLYGMLSLANEHKDNHLENNILDVEKIYHTSWFMPHDFVESNISRWSKTAKYKAEDRVIVNGVDLYQCVSPNIDEVPPNASWKFVETVNWNQDAGSRQ